MNTVEQIILVILAAALAVFLILAIVIAVQVIRIIKTLEKLANKAEHLVDSAESAADMVRNTVGQLSILRFVHHIVDMVTKNKSDKTQKGD
jgi:hypothetical protein